MRKATEETKAIAFKDWFAGLTHREIARKYHVSVKTIESWAQKNEWGRLKAVAVERAKNSLSARFEEKIIRGGECFLDIALKIAVTCKERLQNEQDNISEIVSLALKGVQIYKAAMPEASEQLAKQIARDLQELKMG